ATGWSQERLSRNSNQWIRSIHRRKPTFLKSESNEVQHSMMKTLCLIVAVSVCSCIAYGQDTESSDPAPKRIFGIVPNYRTSATLKDSTPLTPRQKFKIATDDSFDRGSVVLGALFGGLGQLTNSTPSFGQGAAGYAKYFAASYGDFVSGNYMTEAIYPAILHQDPRYFRRGTGGTWSRIGSAV